MTHVLDASALLAWAQSEVGGERVAAVLNDAFMSTVNLSEVVAKIVERGASYRPLQLELAASGMTLVGFEPADAYAAGELRAATRRFGLSFGDRACLALAKRLDRPVLTADRTLGEAGPRRDRGGHPLMAGAS